MMSSYLTTVAESSHCMDMKRTKAMTIRLTSELAAELETVATVDQRPMSDVIREAITHHVGARKRDPAFKDGLRTRIERAQQMLGE